MALRLVRLGVVLALLVAAIAWAPAIPVARAAGANTCDGPFPPITSLPFTDTGDTSTATENAIGVYPGTGTLTPYGGNEHIYSITLQANNSLAFQLSGQPNVTDMALFLVRTCGNGNTLEAFSADVINDTSPETISLRTYPAGTYYLFIDAFSGASGYPRYGQYSLSITGVLGGATPTPTRTPTPGPTNTPTSAPTFTPTTGPTFTPTASPSPTFTPTASPSPSPTFTPTAEATATPTTEPTATPTVVAPVWRSLIPVLLR